MFVGTEFNFCTLIFQYLKGIYCWECGGEEIAACVRLKQNSDIWQNHARLAKATSACWWRRGSWPIAVRKERESWYRQQEPLMTVLKKKWTLQTAWCVYEAVPSIVNIVCYSSHALREDSQWGEEFINGRLGFLIVHELAEYNSSLSNEDLKENK